MGETGENESVAPLDAQSDGEVGLISEKRAFDNGENGELDIKSAKRAKSCGGEMRRVAEIVMVLSAMAGMRGARKPTEAEVNLMAEARTKLVEICQDLAPKDLVARDAIGTVIEDLGLNWKLKDQRLGYRGSRLSIKEKLSLVKRKMEESKKFGAPSGTYMAQASHTSRMFPSDKQSNAPLSSGGVPGSFSFGRVSAATSTCATYQPVTIDVRASTVPVTTGLPSSQVALPRVEKPHGTSYATQVQASPSTNHALVNAPTWSIQPHSTSLAKFPPENKVLNHNPVQVEGTADFGMPQVATQVASNDTLAQVEGTADFGISFVTQTATASPNVSSIYQPMQSVKYARPPSVIDNHNEIVKIVQKLLQPKLPEHPTWNPPSREYMNKALTCQMCKLTVIEVETVALCDACEKGFHLRCLETINQKVPRGSEWHCRKCLALSHGKPLPPKYGRVMRSMTPAKAASAPTAAQSSLEKKIESVDPRISREKAANGSSGLQSPPGSGTVGSNLVELASDLKIPNTGEMPGNGITSSEKEMDQGAGAGIFPNNSTKSLNAVCDSLPVVSSSEKHTQQTNQASEPSIQEERSVSELKYEYSKPTHNPREILQTEQSNSAEVSSKTCEDHPMVEETERMGRNSDCTSRFHGKQSDQDNLHASPAGNSEPNNGAKHAGLSSDGFRRVEWVGNVTKVVDGKTFYESCCIDGVTYKVQEHALFRSSHEKVIPFKIQAMWEDCKSGLKWVILNQCYFPGDLPEAVGHPCSPETNEVYESNHESSVMIDLIQGPCEVLPPTKFKEKCERQSQLGIEANIGYRPFFVCKWFFDEFKGNFQPVFG